jgi:hypothetical protein
MTDITTFVATRVPTGRDLQRSELVELVTAVGTTPELWHSKVRHDAGERIYVQLYRDTDHDLSSGAVYVYEGTLVEDRFDFGTDGLAHASRERRAGEVFEFDAAYIHGVRHAGGPPATSLHCYSPPLWRMGYYDADQHGSLCRTSMSYLEEVGEGHTH